MTQGSIYEFWNKVPGPGEFETEAFKAIPGSAAIWEGVRIGVTEYLGERWVLETVDQDNVVVRRTDRPAAFRLKQTFKDKTGDLNYAMWTATDIPDEQAFTYMVGTGTFKQAITRDLGLPVGFSCKLGPPPGPGIDYVSTAHKSEMMIAVSVGEAPTAAQQGLVARWFIWSILALQWVAESIEANPNP